MAFCGLSSVASAGRMLYAFSRDDGLPGSGWLKKVSHTYRTPANSLDRDRRHRVAVHGRGVHRRDTAPRSSSSRPSARSSCTQRTGSASTWARPPMSGSRSESGAWVGGHGRSPGSPSPGCSCSWSSSASRRRATSGWPFMVVTVLSSAFTTSASARRTFKGPRLDGRQRGAHRDRTGVLAGSGEARAAPPRLTTDHAE